ncbi:MAG: hypothetical protein CL678_18770 [Bdellovibrionaceae bacterium]|nr:hypothetical protein [Pseudobdellovibrionaceae bacterium]
MIIVPFLFSACRPPENTTPPSVVVDSDFPILLNENFYSPRQVCEHAKQNRPDQKFALVLLKTHLCDSGTGVCMMSLLSFSDSNHRWLKENFQRYHTRFFAYTLEGKEVWQNTFALKNLIAESWGKNDVNPEISVLDLTKPCDSDSLVIGRHYLMEYTSAFNGVPYDQALIIESLVYSVLLTRYSRKDLVEMGLPEPELSYQSFSQFSTVDDAFTLLSKLNQQTRDAISEGSLHVVERNLQKVLTNKEIKAYRDNPNDGIYFHFFTDLNVTPQTNGE